MSLDIVHRDTFSVYNPLEEAAGVAFATVGGTPYLFATGYAGDGVAVFSIGAGGALTQVDAVRDVDLPGLELDGANALTTVVVGGVTYLVVAGYDDDGLSVFSVAADGSLTNVSNVTDNIFLNLDGAGLMSTALLGGASYLFVPGQFDNGFTVFRVNANGELSSIVNIDDDATLHLDDAYASATATIGGVTYLFVGGFGDHGISVFAVANDGSVTNVDNVGDDATLNLFQVNSLATAAVDGVTYLFATGSGDNGVSVFSVAADGTLTNVDNVSDDGALFLNRASSVTTAQAGGFTYLFVASLTDDGVSVFRVDPGGTLVNVANLSDSAGTQLDGAIAATAQVIGGVTYLAVAGFDDHGVSLFQVGADGSLTSTASTPEPTAPIRYTFGLAASAVGGVTYLFVPGDTDDGIATFSVGADGTLTNVANITDDGALLLNNVEAVTTAVVDGVTYLVAAGRSDHGLSVFRVEANGSLVNVFNIADDATRLLNGAASLATAEIGGIRYVFTAAVGDRGISVFAMAADGSLTLVDDVADDATLYLFNARLIATAAVGAATYLFASGVSEDGVSVFSVAADGTLTNVFNVGDDATLQLDGVSALATATAGGTTYLFASSISDNGVSVFAVGADGALTNVDNITDDAGLLLGQPSSLSTARIGGITYLFASSEGEHGVSAFEVGPGGTLTHIGNIADDATTDIRFPSAMLTANSGGRDFLFVANYDLGGFSAFELMSTLSMTVTGTNGPDALMGGAGGDTMFGLDGDDVIEGLAGGDTIFGGGGHDRIDGGGGPNQLHGGAGNDFLTAVGDFNVAFGDEGHDQLFFVGIQNQLFGSDGNDWLGVSGVNNALAGGAGDDWIGASGASNTVAGQDGHDSVFAVGTGNYLHGEAGNDWVGVSGTGNFLFGGAGNDWLGASGGNNTLDGGAGDDTLVAAAGHSGATFVFHAGYGRDEALGFSVAGDTVDLRGFGLATFAALQPFLSQVGADVQIALNGADVLTLRGTSLAALTGVNFDLV